MARRGLNGARCLRAVRVGTGAEALISDSGATAVPLAGTATGCGRLADAVYYRSDHISVNALQR
jgi:hypothetical protein